MKEDLIPDLWSVIVDHIPDKQKKTVAEDFVSTLVDHGIKESVLDRLMGIDPYLDDAIEYATDGEQYHEEDDYDRYEDED